MIGPIGSGWLRPKESAAAALPAAAPASAKGSGFAVGQKRKWEDIEQPPADERRPLRLKYNGPQALPSDNVYVTGIPSSLDKDALAALFAEHGFTVQRARIMPDALGTGYSAGMVQFGDQSEAAAAIEAFTGLVVDAPPLLDADGVPKGIGSAGWKGSKGKTSKGVPSKGKSFPSAASTGSWSDGKGSPLEWWGSSSGDWQDAGEQGSLDSSWGGGGNGDTRDSWSGASTGQAKGKSSWNGLPHGGHVGGPVGGWSGGGTKGAPKGSAVSVDGWGGSGKKGKGGKEGKGSGKGGCFSGALTVKFNGRDNVPSDNLYVHGLPNTIQDYTLREIFQGQGFEVVQAKVLHDTRGAGVSAALVRLKSMEDAALAIEMMNGKTLQPNENAMGAIAAPSIQKALFVKYAGKDSLPSQNLYMSNVPAVIDQNTLTAMFTNAGCTVVRTKIIYDQWGTGYNATMIELGSQQEAAAAIEAFSGQILQIDESTGDLTLATFAT
ncbi:unnamed protein product [Prorocentrum cordatum]|uniref:RRM domain-containing protein n=1 Tax=Prorocentrum cordatum TaxID=2364126 RepID=A0ABN9REU7_9DINO|nr:unnamed protein product [Polarella glacialis]